MGTLPRSGRCEVATTASPDTVWAIVSDVTRVGEWSHECNGAEWVDGATTARPGARFRGRNRVGRAKWARVSEIVIADPPREISWRTVPTRLYPDSTVWTITVEPAEGGGSTIVQRFQVVKINPFAERLFYLLVPQHRDRSAALRGDIERLGARAAELEPADRAG
jgi:uncharacterized protein YndB with AHSA1/START domain